MELRSLATLNFRNLLLPRVDFPAGVVAVVGPNGAGKSNLLSAAYLGCNATPASGTLAELVTIGEEQAYVAAEVSSDQGVSRVEVGIALSAGAGRKSVKVDGQVARTVDVARVVGAVMMTPQDSELVGGSPGTRRAFLDSLLSRLSARYSVLLREYQRVLEQRNALLRNDPRSQSLATWTQRLVELGSELDSLRTRVMIRLCPLAAAVYRDVASSQEPFEVELSRNWTEASLAEAVDRSRTEEAARATTVVGPHRDDLVLTLAGRSLKAFGSRGEARTAALALKVAEYRLLDERHGEPPVLLVDDFSAELDSARRAYLLDLVAHTPQALVSGTEAPRRYDALFDIADGEVRLEGVLRA
ncbi:MAG TPA: DNA replication and repair protein RecF [Trueperaceae bacterium]|nr:DNA replication and repair protein RecF [Trueperaceae bacterium]